MKNSNEFNIGFWLKKPLKRKDGRISIYAFLLEFESYLRSCGTIVKNIPLSNNVIMKRMERFKKMVTFLMARHTCATAITFINKMSIETASKLLGHTKLSTTQRNTQRLWKRRLVRIYVPSNRVWELNH